MTITDDTIQRIHSIAELQAKFQEYSARTSFPSQPAGLYDGVRHIMAIPGKRLRPLLLLAAADMFGANPDDALPAALATEWYHNSTLVHDDIMDEADIRRGNPTVHKLYGTSAAINAGDVMIIKAYGLLAKLPQDKIAKTVSIFSKAATEIIEGQTMDIEFESRTHVTEPEYLKMVEYKTSVLLAAALQIGAVLGNADDSDAKNIYEFGRLLGISFQIKDDWLDTFGEENAVGKKIGGDISRNKHTLLYIRALSSANESQQSMFSALRTEPDISKKIAETISLYNTLNIKENTNQTATLYYTEALQKLDAINLSSRQKQTLLTLAKNIYERTF